MIGCISYAFLAITRNTLYVNPSLQNSVKYQETQ